MFRRLFFRSKVIRPRLSMLSHLSFISYHLVYKEITRAYKWSTNLLPTCKWTREHNCWCHPRFLPISKLQNVLYLKPSVWSKTMFSHKRFVVTRPSKLDPMLICSNDLFRSKVTTSRLSYHACATYVTTLFTQISRGAARFFDRISSLRLLSSHPILFLLSF